MKTREILITKRIDDGDIYMIFMNEDNSLIDNDWEDIKADFMKEKGEELRMPDKHRFSIAFSLQAGFIWIERDVLFRVVRPLTVFEISDRERAVLKSDEISETIFINTHMFYVNVLDFIQDTEYVDKRFKLLSKS